MPNFISQVIKNHSPPISAEGFPLTQAFVNNPGINPWRKLPVLQTLHTNLPAPLLADVVKHD
jgi:hypothetical protein